jgi:hypothetical protein
MSRMQQYFFILFFVLLPLILAGVMAVVLRFPWYAVIGGIGLSLTTGSWLAIYLRIRRELSEHPLATASYFAPRLRDWNIGIRLVIFYFRRYGLDARSVALLIGLAMLSAPVVTQNVQAIRTMLSNRDQDVSTTVSDPR